MTEIYRLTVRTVDGVRFISDYTTPQIAESKRNRFMALKDALAYNWKEGDISVRVFLDKITTISIQKIEVSSENDGICCNDQKNEPINKLSIQTYIDTIGIKEVN